MSARCIAILLLALATGGSIAADPPKQLQLDREARVGFLYLLENRLTHYHVGSMVSGNQYRMLEVDWPVRERFEKPILEAIAQRGYIAVPVAASEAALADRLNIFAKSGMVTGPGMSKLALEEYRRVAAAENLAALVVVAPFGTDTVMSAGSFMTRLTWTFPDLAADWGVGTRGKHGKSNPFVFNLSQLLLLDVRSGIPLEVGTVNGAGDAVKWGNANWPEDMRTAPAESFVGARPVLEAMIDREVNSFLRYIAPAITL